MPYFQTEEEEEGEELLRGAAWHRSHSSSEPRTSRFLRAPNQTRRVDRVSSVPASGTEPEPPVRVSQEDGTEPKQTKQNSSFCLFLLQFSADGLCWFYLSTFHLEVQFWFRTWENRCRSLFCRTGPELFPGHGPLLDGLKFWVWSRSGPSVRLRGDLKCHNLRTTNRVQIRHAAGGDPPAPQPRGRDVCLRTGPGGQGGLGPIRGVLEPNQPKVRSRVGFWFQGSFWVLDL